jgi:hypothetical protein
LKKPEDNYPINIPHKNDKTICISQNPKMQNNSIIYCNPNPGNMFRPENKILYPVSTVNAPFTNLQIQYHNKAVPQNGINVENTNNLNIINFNNKTNEKIT